MELFQEQGPADELAKLAEQINADHAAGEAAIQKGLQKGLPRYHAAGVRLLEAKTELNARLGHGLWMDWLKTNCPTICARRAQRYMLLAKYDVTSDLTKEWRSILGNVSLDDEVSASDVADESAADPDDNDSQAEPKPDEPSADPEGNPPQPKIKRQGTRSTPPPKPIIPGDDNKAGAAQNTPGNAGKTISFVLNKEQLDEYGKQFIALRAERPQVDHMDLLKAEALCRMYEAEYEAEGHR